MADVNESFQEAICIDDEIFFGPVTDKERKIREQFENKFKSITDVDSNKALDNEISRNDSLYKSFSAESKYDSFDDSLNIEVDDKPEGLKQITMRKSFDKLKSKSHGFYDSLEDVCSLISNIDKCSISCDVESSFAEMHNIEDSLKNAAKAFNNNHSPHEQVHFDDDSLAILELESTFDDSLEEFSVQNIEIEEINKENIVTDCLNKSCDVEQKYPCVTRNLFDTSVEIIYEKKTAFDTIDEISSSDEKNKLFDSLSNSEFKDILKDSLEEPKVCIKNLSPIDTNVSKSAMHEYSQVMSFDKETFDSSIQIIYKKVGNFPTEQNMFESSISNSECADLSKDSLENVKNENIVEAEQTYQKIGAEDISVKLPSMNDYVFSIHSVPNQELITNKFSEGSRESTIPSIQNFKNSKDSVVTTNHIPVSSESDTHEKDETVALNSCHLEFVNDNLELYGDLKSQLQGEATVVNKNLQLASDYNEQLSKDDNYKSNVSSSTVEFKNKMQAVKKKCSNSNLEVQNISAENILCETKCNDNVKEMFLANNEANITQRIKPKLLNMDTEIKCSTRSVANVRLLQALDLHDISTFFFSESFIQSEDSVMSLNLCSKEQIVQIPDTFMVRTESKENMPELNMTSPQNYDKDFHCSKSSSHKVREDNKTPKNTKNYPKGTPSKRTPGTKIPVRKVEKFAMPTSAQKIKHQVPKVASAEKIRKWPLTPYTCEAGKKTPVVTPAKGHYCKVRNTIFSKVPQITPSKKFMNIQSPVAQYIRNTQGHTVRTPKVDPVLRDCMNDIYMRQQLETPHQAYHHETPKSAPVKLTKRKA